MSHSPTPLSAHSCDAIATDGDNGDRFIEIISGPVTFSPYLGYRNGRIAHGTHVATVWGTGVSWEARNANAALIVHRVNTYDALVEALANLCTSMECWAGCDEGCSNETASREIMKAGGACPSVVYDHARAALALAKESQS